VSSESPAAGAVMAVTAYGLWGLFPIYWKLLDHVPAAEVFAHRIVWSLGFILLLLGVLRSRGRVVAVPRKHWAAMVLSTSLVGMNWFVFIWAVSVDRVTEASLGYYINPLLNVALARLFLGETLRPMQSVSVGLAATGVVHLTLARGSLPWVSLLLATSFAFYGLVRKRTPVGAAEGLAIETGLVTPLCLGLLLTRDPPLGALVTTDVATVLLLLGSGVATSVPLLAFAGAAKRLRYSTLGMVQYLAPTLQLGCAVLIYGEPFDRADAITFALIWSAVLLYLFDLLRARRAAPA